MVKSVYYTDPKLFMNFFIVWESLKIYLKSLKTKMGWSQKICILAGDWEFKAQRQEIQIFSYTWYYLYKYLLKWGLHRE